MFKITIDCHGERGEFDSEDTTLSEAVESTYTPANFEAGGTILFHWNQISIPLPLDCMSDLIDCIFWMFDAILNGDDFDLNILCWLFTVTWSFEIQNSMLKIVSRWWVIKVDEHTREILNSDKSVLIIDKKNFMQEWFKLLSIIRNDLKIVGYDFPEFNDKLSAYAAFLQE